jgi:hypothetical protein
MPGMLFRLKKAKLIPATFVALAVVIVSFFILLYFFASAGQDAQGIASEQFCRRSNELAVGLIPQLARQTLGSIQGCKTLDQGALPSGGHVGVEGAQGQIATLVERCWWMWLEGVTGPDGKKDVLTATLGSNGKQCFICSTFSLDKDLEFSASEFSQFLAMHPYRVRDASDQCAGIKGGYCLESCEEAATSANGGLISLSATGPSSVEVSEVESQSCSQGERCCVAKRDQCISKGGLCLLEDDPIFIDTEIDALWFRYAHEDGGWACSTGSCYVAQSNFMSTIDYVQQFEGPGVVLFGENILQNEGIPKKGDAKKGGGFQSGELYAVAFIEDTTFSPGLIGGAIGGTAGVVGGAAVLGLSTAAPVVIGLGVVGAIVGYYDAEALQKLFGDEDIDGIVIAEHDEVKTLCAVDSGVGTS